MLTVNLWNKDASILVFYMMKYVQVPIDGTFFVPNVFEMETNIQWLVTQLTSNVKLVMLVSVWKQDFLSFLFTILLIIWSTRRDKRIPKIRQSIREKSSEKNETFDSSEHM